MGRFWGLISTLGLGFIFSVVFAQTGSSASLEPYTYVFNQKRVTVPIGKVDGIRVNDVCLNSQDACQALKIFHHPPAGSSHPGGKMETHASEHCHAVGGTPLVLTGPDQSGSLFCVFKDLSMVDARAMEHAHFQKGASR